MSLGLGTGFYGIGPGAIGGGNEPTVVSGDGNYVLVPLTGFNNYVDLGDAYQSTFRGSWTFSTYFRISTGTDFAYFLGNRSVDGSLVIKDQILLWTQDGKAYSQNYANYDLHNVQTSSSHGSLISWNAQWQHIAFSVMKNSSPSNTTIGIYINGSAVAHTTLAEMSETNHEQYTETKNLFLGAVSLAGSVGLSHRTFAFKHTAIWNTNLDAANITEVSVSANSSSSVGSQFNPLDLTSASGDYDTQGNLVAWWRMDDGTGVTAVDYSGNGNNATLVGDAVFF